MRAPDSDAPCFRAPPNPKAQEQRSRMGAIAMSSGDAIVGLDNQAIVTDWNGGAERLYGYSVQEMVGRPLEHLVPSEWRDQLSQVLSRVRRGESVQNFETQRLRKDGSRVDVSISVAAVVNEAGRIIGAGSVARDITERKHLEDQLRRQALYDGLTGLPNRMLFMDRLDHALHSATRAQSSVTILFMDLDHFKLVNDSFGHGVGDQLLVSVGRRLAGCLRPGDTLARLGGDEFTVLLEGTPTAQDATSLAERILLNLEAPFHLSGHEVYAMASLGIVSSSDLTAGPEALLREADIALYRAKAAGKGQSSVFEATSPSRPEFDRQAAALAEQAELLDLAHDAILVWDIHTGEIRFWNRGAEELYGWKKADVLGRTPQAILQTGFPIPLSEINAVLVSTRRWEGELVHTRKDGSRVVVSSRWALQLDRRGRPRAVLGINSDITDHKRVETALRESEKRYRLFYKGIPIPTYSWRKVNGDDFLLEDCNDAAMAFMANASAWLGKLASECLGEPSSGLAALRECVALQRGTRRETIRIHRSTSEEQTTALSYVFIPPDVVMVYVEDARRASLTPGLSQRERETPLRVWTAPTDPPIIGNTP